MPYPLFKFSDFKGIYTRASRSNRPLGTVDDSLNVVPNTKTGKMCLRTGYTADISSAITDVAGTTLTVIQNQWKTQTENPTTTNIDVVAGTTSGASKYVFQKPFFKQSATATDSWVDTGEYLNTTIATVSGDFITYTLTAGSASNDYYNGWHIYNDTKNEGATILDYTGSSKTIVTAQPNGDGSHGDWAVGNVVFLLRYAHDRWDPSYVADFDTQPNLIQLGSNYIFSNKKASGNYPLWSGYINATFFPDAATSTFTYQGTYTESLEIGQVNMGAGAIANVAELTDPLPSGFRYFVLVVCESIDGLLSEPDILTAPIYDDVSTDERIDVTFKITPDFDKRIRYVNLFMASGSATETSVDWSRYFYVDRIDLTASEGFTWTLDDATQGNCWIKAKAIKGAQWASRGSDLLTYVGTTIYGGSSIASTPIYALSALVSGRLFVAKYRDPIAAKNFDNSIRFSTIGNGVSRFNVLPNIGDFSETTLGYGDDSNITQLLGYESNLVVFKTGSVSYINITDDPLTWTQVPIQKYSGCDAPYSVVTTPYGIVWANSNDDVYLWNGGSVKSLAKNWLTTYRAFTTTPTSWLGWYNEANKSYNLACNMSDKTVWYEMFFERPLDDAFVWVRHQGADAITWVHTRSDGTVFFVKSASDDTFYFNSAATADNATTIKPYFDTGDYVVDEGQLISPKSWYLAVSGQAGSPAGTLDAKLYVDGTAVSVGGANPYLALTTTNPLFKRPIPLINGTRVRFEFNTNATKASLGTAYTIEELGIEYTLRTRKGDAALL